jgi:glycosyltransferase involved in cell wall biosynthesis
MNIALLQPSYWPEVRRGTERIVHDLGSHLADRGHDVTLITSHSALGTNSYEDGMTVIRAKRPPRLPPLERYELHLESAPAAAWHLLRAGYDIAHAFAPSYAWAGVKARRLGGPPIVFSFHGIPERRYLIARRYRLEMLRAIVAEAAATTVLSEAARRTFRRYLLIEPVLLPGAVNHNDFAGEVDRAPTPTLICSSSLGDPRKGAGLLFRAFGTLRSRRPDAKLVLVRTPDPIMSPASVTLPRGASWTDGDAMPSLAKAYREAWTCVLAANDEAFGLVLVESMAAGTPVVAPRSGGCPEIVDRDEVGRVYEPGDEAGLVEAIDETLELAQQPNTAAACRDRAAEFDWARILPLYERLYESVLERTV